MLGVNSDRGVLWVRCEEVERRGCGVGWRRKARAWTVRLEIARRRQGRGCYSGVLIRRPSSRKNRGQGSKARRVTGHLEYTSRPTPQSARIPGTTFVIA